MIPMNSEPQPQRRPACPEVRRPSPAIARVIGPLTQTSISAAMNAHWCYPVRSWLNNARHHLSHAAGDNLDGNARVDVHGAP